MSAFEKLIQLVGIVRNEVTPYGLPGSNEIKYMYDAAGNKLQKYVKMDDCDPATQLPCNGITETRFDYIGNFVYENGALKMIYHPEGDEALRFALGEQFSFGPACRVGDDVCGSGREAYCLTE